MTQSFEDALQNSLLSKVLAQAKQHLMMDALLKTYLDEQLRKHCQVVQYAEDTLIVHLDSSAWLARIHYQAPQLVLQLKSSHPALFTTLQKIKCQVRPALTPTRGT